MGIRRKPELRDGLPGVLLLTFGRIGAVLAMQEASPAPIPNFPGRDLTYICHAVLELNTIICRTHTNAL